MSSPPPRATRPARDAAVALDVVIPVYNEDEVLGPLVERLRSAFAPAALAAHGIRSVRHLFVDDGSTDGSAEKIAAEIRSGLPALLLRLSRNFGHQNAVSAGMDHARADLVAVIDADLQDPPELVLEMVDLWRQGFDVVHGQRRTRKENPLKVAGYWLFYRLIALLADIRLPLDAGDFCLMDRRVVERLSALPEKLRFPRVLRAWVGFRQTGLAYDRPGRRAGKSKYSFARLYRLATEGVASASIRPLQLAQFFSFSYLLLTLGIGALLLLRPPDLEIPNVVLWGVLLIVSGTFVQVFCIYILGAYVGRTYLEVKGRPAYVVMELLEGGEASEPGAERA